jgi:hypothetical protein
VTPRSRARLWKHRTSGFSAGARIDASFRSIAGVSDGFLPGSDRVEAGSYSYTDMWGRQCENNPEDVLLTSAMFERLVTVLLQ